MHSSHLLLVGVIVGLPHSARYQHAPIVLIGICPAACRWRWRGRRARKQVAQAGNVKVDTR